MRRLFLLCCVFGLAACKTSSLGTCATDTDCLAGSRCDATQSPPVCVVPQGDCFPVCANGKTCQAGSCVSAACDPPCDVSHVCDQGTLACVAVSSPQIIITSPVSGGYASGAGLQATVSARAPGGVSAVKLRLSTAAGALLASANAVATPTQADPANWAATLPLTGLADGPAQLVATATYGTAALTAASTPVLLTVDTHAPLVTLLTDGRGQIHARGQTAQIGATVSDGTSGSGVDPASVVLILDGVAHAPFPGVAAGGQYNFAVLIDDSVMASGSSGTFQFRIDAKDKAGNSAELAGLPGEVLRVDRDGPRIAQISVTPPDYLDTATGRGYYLNDAGPLSVTAQITDFAGVDPAAVCLHATGDGAGCPHPGSSADGGFWSFALPRPALSAQDDGSAATQLSISAQDSLAALLDGGVAEHQSASDAGAVYFDNLGPSVQVSADGAPYARAAANVLTVQATITSPIGLSSPPKLISNGLAQAPISSDGGVYLFQLKTIDAPAGAEGNYQFDVLAIDKLLHTTDAQATRLIDDAPPALALKIYSGAEPAAVGVSYPAAVSGTGWTGSLFIYSDQVHVKGTLSDVSGLAGAAATLHLDGTGADGGMVPGTKTSLGCADGQTSCSFDVQLKLNAPGNGPFNSGTTVTAADSNGNLLPLGTLTFAIDAQDRARNVDGGPAPHAGTTRTPVNATRFLWQASASGTITGLAVHPDGDLIATVAGASATSDSIYAFYPDGAAPGTAPAATAVHWSAGADAGIGGNAALGSIPDQPAIGKGDAASAPIYVASGSGAIAALNPDGTMRWHADGLDAFSVGPAVGTATVAGTGPGTGVVEQVIVPSNKPGAGVQQHLWAAWQNATPGPVKVNSTRRDALSSPVLLNGFVWYGDNGGVSQFSYGAGGLAQVAHDTTVTGPYFDLATDGTNLFGATNAVLWAFGQNFAQIWQNQNFVPNQAPILGALGLLVSDNAGNVQLVNPADGAPLGSAALNGNGLVPLEGSGGRVYLPRTTAVVYAFDSTGAVSWYFDPPNAIFRGFQLDCAGHFFAASGNTVYALVSDDRGLANSAWPNYRRDGRNTGNASALPYGINNGSCAP